MMNIMKKIILSAIMFAYAINSFAEEEEKLFKIDVYGFVNYEMMFDTRQVVSARDGHVLLYPANEKFDDDGNDINATPSFNFLVLSSRLGGKISGPKAFGAKTMAHIEGDLMGTGGSMKSHARLRHAYVSFIWERSELLAGQTWHPMFVAACFPHTVTFAGGVPYHALNRSPQLKYAYNLNAFKISAALMSHNDFASLGPSGASSEYIRNSMFPEIAMQALYNTDKFLLGFTGGYQVIMPQKETPEGYSTDEKMKSMYASFFTKIVFPSLTFKTQTSYGENNGHLVMLGGYGQADIIDTDREIYSYEGIHALSSWIDFETNGDKFKAGLLAGYAQNLGAKKEITTAYARGSDIAHMYRIAPRVVYSSGKVKLGLEFHYDVAAYGIPDAKFNFNSTKDIANIRTVLSIKYVF